METRQGYFKGGADHPLSDADLDVKFFANCAHGGIRQAQAQNIHRWVKQVFDAPLADAAILSASA